jgi:hypothetical protein
MDAFFLDSDNKGMRIQNQVSRERGCTLKYQKGVETNKKERYT